MSDANPMSEKPMPDGRTSETPKQESLWWRLLWMVIIAVLMSLALTILGALTVIQLILMAVTKARPNAEIAAFGKRLGPWLAKAARYQTADSDEKPWPWAPLD